jgi:hypothetical protein
MYVRVWAHVNVNGGTCCHLQEGKVNQLWKKEVQVEGEGGLSQGPG